MPFKTGQSILRGEYRVLKGPREGNQGRVYKVRRVSSGQVSALKELKEEYLNDEAAKMRLFREWEAVCMLDCDYVVQVIDRITPGSTGPVGYYLIEEWMEGGSLRDRLEVGRLSVDEVAQLLHRMCKALLGIRKRQIVHRDIKPENILYSASGLSKLADFGCSRTYHGAPLTLPGEKVGTVQYMSPEQLQGHAPKVSFDIYSLGATVYEALTGRQYLDFTGDYDHDCRLVLSEATPVPIEQLQPDSPPELNAIIMKMLDRSVQE